jgi:hypothetical protein
MGIFPGFLNPNYPILFHFSNSAITVCVVIWLCLGLGITNKTLGGGVAVEALETKPHNMLMKKHIVLDPQVHEKLRERQLALSCLRPHLSLQQVIELLVVKAKLEHEDVMAFEPSTRKPGRPRRGS